MTDESLPAESSKPKHLFKKGQSGNPKGRPPGSKNQVSLLKVQIESELRAQMKDHMPALLDKAIELALEGDKEMIKMLYGSWVTKSVAKDDEPQKDKIQIIIGKLDQIPAVKGRTIQSEDE